MITVSSAYETAINASSRYIVPKVEVYFDGDSNPPTIFTGSGLTKIRFLEEASADNGNPLGLVSSNDIELSFDNSSRNFTPTNTAGLYYGKLKPNVLVKPYLGLELPGATYEYIPLGVFRTGDWSSPSGTVEATVTCFDRLYEIGDKDVPMLPVKQNTTVGELFVLLFTALGITDFSVDASLNQPIPIDWLPQGNVRNALQTLAVAGNCSVATNRYGYIVVRSNFITGTVVETWTDANQIFTAENPQKYLDTYSKVKINYYQPYIKPSASLLKVENLKIPNGGLTLTNISFTTGPVATVDQVILSGAVNSLVDSVEYGAWGITVTITNTSVEETVTLEVTGKAIDSISSSYELQDDTAVASFGEKVFPVENYLIQSLDVAKTYAAELLQYVKDPLANISLSIRGNPAVEVGDVIQIQNDTDKIGTVDFVPTRITLNYDGALDSTVEGRKVAANTRYTWAYIGPGMYEYVEY